MTFHAPGDKGRRVTTGRLKTDESRGPNGAFYVDAIVSGRQLLVISTNTSGWEHVSLHVVGTKGKLLMPTWPEMCHIKSLFWDPEDCVMQLHPSESEWVNQHPTTLHLWRPIGADIPQPPSILVGEKGVTHEETMKRMASVEAVAALTRYLADTRS